MNTENRNIDKLTRELIDFGTPQPSAVLKLNIMQQIMHEAKVMKRQRVSSSHFSLNWLIGIAVYMLVCILALIVFQINPQVVKQSFMQLNNYLPFVVAAFVVVLSFFFFVQLDKMLAFCRCY